MDKYIQYIDNQGRDTEIYIYDYKMTGHTEYHEFEGTGDNVLQMKWYGDDDSVINGSEIQLNFWIKNETERNILLEIFTGNDQHYVKIFKDSVNWWYGKVMDQFFVERYAQYPYMIDISASDQIGAWKDESWNTSKFSSPFITGSTLTYSLMDVLSSTLTEDDFNPAQEAGGVWANTPSILNVACRINLSGSSSRTLEDIYIDPRIFQDDDNFIYLNKTECFATFLDPMNMKLYQWAGEWWLVSNDSGWSGGTFKYDQYILSFASNTAVWNSEENFDGNILEPWQLVAPSTKGTLTLENDAQLEYEAAITYLNIKNTYIKNDNILYGAFNNFGEFYTGDGDAGLELSSNGEELNYWEDFFFPYWTGGTAPDVKEFINDTGQLENEIQYDSDNDPWFEHFQFNQINTYIPGGCRIDKLELTVDSSLIYGTVLTDDNLSMYMAAWFPDSDPQRYYLGLEPWATAPVGIGIEPFPYYDWDDESVLFSTPYQELFPSNEGNNLRLGFSQMLTDNLSTGAELVFNTFKLTATNQTLEALDYNFDWNYDIQPLSSGDVYEKEFNWGLIEISSLFYPTYNSELLNHMSTAREEDGTAIPKWHKNGIEHVGVKSLTEWFYWDKIIERSTSTKTLTSTIRSDELTPNHLIFDYDGTVYKFQEGEYNDKTSTWNNKYIEYKGVSYAGQQILGDFNYDFNFDFFLFE